MQSNYIVKSKDGNIFLYTYFNNSIVKKSFDNGKQTNSEVVASGVRENFTVSINSNDEVFIFCQDLEYNIVLVRNNTRQVILENTKNEKSIIYFHSVVNNDKITLVYNTPKDSNNVSYLYTQSIKGTVFRKAEMIDSFIPFKNTYVDTLNINNNLLIFYKNNNSSNKIGYIGVSEQGLSEYVSYHSTNYDIVDTSNLFVDNELYLCYIVKSSFSYQLFLRVVSSTNISDPIVVTEGQNLDNVLVFYSDKLYIFFTSRDGLYCVTSEDFGKTFSKPKRFNEYGNHYLKAKFITNCDTNMCVNDVYVTKSEPKQIKIMPEIYNDFFNDKIDKVIIKPKQVQQNKEVEQQVRPQVNYENLADLSQQDFYSILYEKKKEKDLLKKQKEFGNVEAYGDDELEKLKRENESLKKALKKFIGNV